MKKFTGLFASLLSLVIFFTFFTGTTQAVYLNSGNVLNLPKDKLINESVFIAGSDLVVDADINGDLFCAGKNITINGDIKGDIICAGQSIKVTGRVDGNLRLAALTVDISGVVSRNVLSFSQSLTLAKTSSVKGDIFFGVQSVDLSGSLGRDLGGAAEQISISGSLLRHAKVTAQRISVIDPAKIGGDFEYYMDETGTAMVDQKNIKGNILRHEIARPELTSTETKDISVIAQAFGKFYWFISTLILGFVLLYFFRSSVEKKRAIISQKPFIVGLTGFAFLVLAPLASLILLVSVVGAPLALALFLCYILSIMFASIVPVLIIGEWLIKLVSKKEPVAGWSLTAGVFFVCLFSIVPGLGALAGFLIFCVGLGATFLSHLPQK